MLCLQTNGINELMHANFIIAFDFRLIHRNENHCEQVLCSESFVDDAIGRKS